MSWTKRQLINQSYGMFGLTSYAFSLTPEQLETAILLLDSMMAAWATTEGIRIGYNQSSTPGQTDPDQDSGVPDFANMGVSFKLSELLAGTIGKAIQPAMLVIGKNAYDSLLSWAMSHSIPEMQYARNTPRGSGNKPYQGAPSGVFFAVADRLDTGAGDGFVDMSDGTAITVDADGPTSLPI